jgi:hypothetical protein
VSRLTLARLTAGVLAIALLVAVPTAATASPASDATTAAKKRCRKGKTRNRSGRCVKKCRKGATRNRSGRCVKKKQPYTGPVPPDNAIGYNTGDGVAFVEITENRSRISSIVRVPADKLTCGPNGTPPWDYITAAKAAVYDMTLDPRTGEFAGSAPRSAGGDGDSAIQGKFLSPTRLMVTATVSNLAGYSPDGAVCGGSNTVTVTLKPR